MGIEKKDLIRVGFWRDTFPKSFVSQIINFVEHLPDPRDLVWRGWPLRERELIAAYLDACPDVEHWMGYAYCRFGCEGGFGTTDKSDGKYLWPEGLSHYVLKHCVRLPEDFMQHIHEVVRRVAQKG